MALGDDEVGVFSLGALLRGHRQAALRLVARQDARRAEEDDGVVDLVALEARVGLHVLGENAQPARRGTLDEGRVAVGRARPLLLGRTQRLRRIARLAFRRIGRLWLRSEEHTSELQSLMRISYAVFCLKKQNTLNRLQLST